MNFEVEYVSLAGKRRLISHPVANLLTATLLTSLTPAWQEVYQKSHYNLKNFNSFAHFTNEFISYYFAEKRLGICILFVLMIIWRLAIKV